MSGSESDLSPNLQAKIEVAPQEMIHAKNDAYKKGNFEKKLSLEKN